MTYKAADLSWAACAIDAEGTITHAQAPGGERSHIRVSVYNTDPRFVLKMVAIFGVGSIRGRSRVVKGRSQRRTYEWTASSRQAAAVLEAIAPYLVIKRDQADLALAICATMSGRRALGYGRGKKIPADVLAERNALSARLTVVKHFRPTLEEVS